MPIGNANLGKGEKLFKASFGINTRQKLTNVFNYLKVKKSSPQFPPFITVQPPIPLTSQLSAYWQLESQSGGQTLDVLGTNALVDASLVTFPAAKIGNGARMAAPNALIENVLNNLFNSASVTWSCWLKVNGFPSGGTPRIISKTGDDGGGLDGFAMVTNSAGNIAMNVNKNGAGFGLNPAGTMAGGTWYFLVFRFDANFNQGSLFWYSESALISQTNGNGNYEAASTFKLNLGNNTISAGFDITIDEVGFWARALSNTDIANLWNNGAGRTYPFI